MADWAWTMAPKKILPKKAASAKSKASAEAKAVLGKAKIELVKAKSKAPTCLLAQHPAVAAGHCQASRTPL